MERDTVKKLREDLTHTSRHVTGLAQKLEKLKSIKQGDKGEPGRDGKDGSRGLEGERGPKGDRGVMIGLDPLVFMFSILTLAIAAFAYWQFDNKIIEKTVITEVVEVPVNGQIEQLEHCLLTISGKDYIDNISERDKAWDVCEVYYPKGE